MTGHSTRRDNFNVIGRSKENLGVEAEMGDWYMEIVKLSGV
jgi:hypothetical protein